jgi:hypothetical protein
MISDVSCPFRAASQIRMVPSAFAKAASRNAKDIMLRSKLPGSKPSSAMPHCTNHFES